MELDKLKVCRHGIAHFYDGKVLHKADQPAPLRHLAQNLKHESHKFLQLIVNAACEIDGSVSAKRVELDNPASRIVAATVLINNFIDMLAAVNDFSPPEGAFFTDSRVRMLDVVEKAVRALSLLKNARRCSGLKFSSCYVPEGIAVVSAARAFENLVYVLVDNVYKYSVEGTEVRIEAGLDEGGLGYLRIANLGSSRLDERLIFDKGYQHFPESDGFGYGLHWAKLLIGYMNEQIGSVVELVVASEAVSQGLYLQRFTLKGLPCG